jgi:hypothetical protein
LLQQRKNIFSRTISKKRLKNTNKTCQTIIFKKNSNIFQNLLFHLDFFLKKWKNCGCAATIGKIRKTLDIPGLLTTATDGIRRALPCARPPCTRPPYISDPKLEVGAGVWGVCGKT